MMIPWLVKQDEVDDGEVFVAFALLSWGHDDDDDDCELTTRLRCTEVSNDGGGGGRTAETQNERRVADEIRRDKIMSGCP